jgi:GNAT superfamily N-acetyltransferase
MLTLKQFLAEEVVISPVTRQRPKMAAGGSDRARNMLASALNNTDRGVKRLMAVSNGEVVGAISYYPGKSRWIIDRVGSLQKGVGTLLMQEVISLARAKGADQVVLWATDTSSSFYDRLGFIDAPDPSDPKAKHYKVLRLQPESRAI